LSFCNSTPLEHYEEGFWFETESSYARPPNPVISSGPNSQIKTFLANIGILALPALENKFKKIDAKGNTFKGFCRGLDRINGYVELPSPLSPLSPLLPSSPLPSLSPPFPLLRLPPFFPPFSPAVLLCSLFST
jgi:hypothetical protein